MAGIGSRKNSARRALALICLATLAAHCPPPPDSDGEPGLAQPLRVGTWYSDQLHCRQGDCADWYRIQLDTPGEVRIELKLEPAILPLPNVFVALGDDRAIVLQEAFNEGKRQSGLRWNATKPGPYFVSVASGEHTKEPVLYQLRTSFRPRRAPPPEVSEHPSLYEPVPSPEPDPTTFQTVSSRLIEVEGQLGQTQTVLFVSDRSHELRRGLRGQLVENGRTIAHVEVIEVYDDGGVRARIDGILTGTITPATRVEIAVPIAEGGRSLER